MVIPFYEACPQTILTISKHAPINTYISLSRIFEEAKQTIEDFDLLLRYYQLHIGENHKFWSIEAPLLYHLGGSVESYRVFDEKLNDGVYILTSQELYYFALTATEINIRKDEHIQGGIEKIKLFEDRNTLDNYYLGHLYLMKGDEENAKICFAENEDHLFSEIMLTFFTRQDVDDLDDIEIHDIDDFTTDIDYKAENLDQFQDYFHYKECLNVINLMDEDLNWSDSVLSQFNIPIWEVFRFSDEVRNDKEDIMMEKDKIIVEILKSESEAIKREIVKKFESKTDVGTEANELLSKIAEDTERYGHYDVYRKRLESAKEETGRKGVKFDIENHIASIIKKFGKDSIYFIYDCFLKNIISSEQAFDLILYLRHKVDEDAFTQIIREIENTGIMTIPGLETIKKGFMSLKNIGLAAYHIVYGNCLIEKNEYTEYDNFKRNLWDIIPSIADNLQKEVEEGKI